MIKKVLIIISLAASSFLLAGSAAALPIGTLLYRTGSGGLAYGYNSPNLITTKNGIVSGIYSGHTAIYVGKENGEDYIVEANPGGIMKVPAKYFINNRNNEKLIGVKLPAADESERYKAALLAKTLASQNLAYDFDLKNQKGPKTGEWTCVGLTEKVYESSNAVNPQDLNNLIYDPNNYAFNITPDGFDKTSLYNKTNNDCFSTQLEFSKIDRLKNIVAPAPELIGYDAGRIYNSDRYIFLPYTQYLQTTLKDVPLDINLASDFDEAEIRGTPPTVALLFRWSLINNPLSSLSNLWNSAVTLASKAVNSLIAKFNAMPDSVITEVSAAPKEIPVTIAKSTSAKTTTAKTALKKPTSTAKTTSAKTTASAKAATVKATTTAKVVKPKTTTTNKTIVVKAPVSTSGSIAKANSPVYTVAVVAPVSGESRAGADLSLPSGVDDDSEIATNYDETSATSSAEANNPDVATSSPDIVDDNPTSTPEDLISTSSEQIIDTGSASSTEATSSDLIDGATSTPVVETSTPTIITTSTEVTTETSTATTTLLTANGIPAIKIASVYTIGLDDYIDLYNPNNFSVDLAIYNYRLERSKTAVDPDILMRIGNTSDGVYPGGTIIAGNGYYRIVRDEAADGIKAGAGAIGSGTNFTFDENSSYTLYLGTGPISSPTDTDIVDIYNVAPMSLTSTPATSTEFYGVYLPGLVHLWHFDECRGTSTTDYVGTSTLPLGGFTWGIGAYGCSLDRSVDSSVMTTNFSKAIDASNFSLNFNYKNSKNNPGRIFMSLLKNDNSGQFVSLQLDFSFTEYQNLPTGLVHNSSIKWPADDAWHQVFLVVNGPADYFELYLDGQKVYHKDFDIRMLPFLSNYFRISPDNGLVSLDELGLWSRPLAESEIKQIYDAHLPLYPNPSLPAQKTPVRLDYYAFNERVGITTKDAVGVDDLTVNANSWIKDGHSAGALFVTHSREILKTISSPQSLGDVSLDFWYREHLTTSSLSRLKIALNGTVDNLFGLEIDQYYQKAVFNSQYETMGQGYDLVMPHDLAWHHAALVYDSYKYLLSFYVDGVLKWSKNEIWIRDETWQKIEIGSGNGQTELDNLEIWDGALNADEVSALSKM